MYPCIPTDEAAGFWQHEGIKDIDALRAHSTQHTYVAIDCEGQEGHGDGVTSIGLAFLPSARPPQTSDLSAWPWTNIDLDDVVASYTIESLSLRIMGRHRGRVAEPYRYGRVEAISSAELKEYVYQRCEAAQQQSGKKLVLVAWSIENEMRAITRLCPSLLLLFHGWVDLADIVSHMSGIRTKRKRSLRDTLLSLGFRNDYSVQTFRPHDPGMDAVRTAAALAGLVACPSRELVIPEFTFEEKERRKEVQKRPARGKFPVAVRIAARNGEPMPKAINSPGKLEDYVKNGFGMPTAVAVCPKGKPEGRKTHGWVYFDTVGEMELFVRQLNGRVVDGVGMVLWLDGPLSLAVTS